MSFFDEGDEPPTRAQPRSRRAPSSARAGTTPEAAIRQRRLIAAAFGLLIVVVLLLGVRGCLSSRAENRLKDYNRDVATVIAQSDRDVSRPLFDLLGQSDGSPVELESQVNQLRNVADRQVQDAEGFDVPDELTEAQHNLLLALDMRASGVSKIAGELRTALADGDQASEAQTQIAAQMQQFLTSDVLYSARVVPYIQETLDEKEIGGQEIASSQFLPDLTWLDPETVSTRLGGSGGGGSSGTSEEPAPGLHGHGLVSVAVGDTTLQPGENSVNRLAAGSAVTFNVTVANQGENPEENVTVSVRVSGSGDPISVRRRIASTQPGANAEVAIPLGAAPPIGTPVTITVSVAKVPGEEKVDNNRQTYTAIFSR